MAILIKKTNSVSKKHLQMLLEHKERPKLNTKNAIRLYKQIIFL